MAITFQSQLTTLVYDAPMKKVWSIKWMKGINYNGCFLFIDKENALAFAEGSVNYSDSQYEGPKRHGYVLAIPWLSLTDDQRSILSEKGMLKTSKSWAPTFVGTTHYYY